MKPRPDECLPLFQRWPRRTWPQPAALPSSSAATMSLFSAAGPQQCRPSDGGWQRRRILASMQDFTRREGYSPSYRQIGERLGIAVSTVSYHVALLKADGSLHREPGQPRTINWPGRPSAAAEGGGAEVPLIGQIAASAVAEPGLRARTGRTRPARRTSARPPLRPAGQAAASAGPAAGGASMRWRPPVVCIRHWNKTHATRRREERTRVD